MDKTRGWDLTYDEEIHYFSPELTCKFMICIMEPDTETFNKRMSIVTKARESPINAEPRAMLHLMDWAREMTEGGPLSGESPDLIDFAAATHAFMMLM